MAAWKRRLTTLLQNQATLVQTQTVFFARKVERDARLADADRINAERFKRIETILLGHSRILADHTRILQALPEAVREKIGFKAPNPQGPAQ